jgi:hypothetical protein
MLSPTPSTSSYTPLIRAIPIVSLCFPCIYLILCQGHALDTM